MDFDLTEEQEEFRKLVRQFAEEVVAPRAEEMDRGSKSQQNAIADELTEDGFVLRYRTDEGLNADRLT
jgi:alkylation response protein AidB-like acyl-CoA dehydrogenase